MIKMTKTERSRIKQIMNKRWSELFFERGYGKVTRNGVWHVGKAELHFEPINDESGQPTGRFEAIIRNKLSYKGTQGQAHNTHYQQKPTGIKFVKSGRDYVSVNLNGPMA